MRLFGKYAPGFLLAFCTCVLTAQAAPGQPGGRGGAGPALVTVAPAHEGVLAPQRVRKGSVYFKEMAEVATEVSGKVIEINFEEGEPVEQGDVLVHLDDTVLRKELDSAKATRARYAAELEDAEARYDRAESLIEDEITTPQQLDQLRFEVQADRSQVDSMRAEVERIQTLIDKNTIRAPFDGIVIDRQTELGEWKGVGDTVAVLARKNLYDVIVDVPEDELRWVTIGEQVNINVASGQALEGEIITIVPRGDIASKLFPVKIRVEPEVSLYEGMTAMVRLPVAEAQSCLFVPRDAILREATGEVVYTVEDGTAQKHQVRVLGYDGAWAGIAPGDFEPGQPFIVKGHERLRGGEPVRVTEERRQRPAGAPADGG